ncbi:helix-turn-helix transcriptional regulator [Mucisphaera calidilacus]|uniref:Regulatory protein SoxS n=1 Tax=Mucisphaera calidilacus TaxID=2527982 RepID=A0A518BX24_9BACT|nr:AraC family transcriptional regulator [Mucisphaera calidilacus]QDU71530.1 Regulatory protein SoxS [Mucisphaera calidilacus]
MSLTNAQRGRGATSYTMIHYAWYTVMAPVRGMPSPFYVGQGVAHSPLYNSWTVPQEPMPEHVVFKLSLSEGGAVWVGDDMRPLRPGEASFRRVEDTEVHEGYHPDYRGEFEFLGFIFSGQSAVDLLLQMRAKYGAVYSLDLESPVVRRMLAQAREPSHYIRMTSSEGVRFYNDLIVALMEGVEDAETSRFSSQLAEQVEHTIRDNLAHAWTVQELAGEYGVTREHLTRAFTRAYGQAPHSYALELRIQEAARRLRHTDQPVKRIAIDLGFGSQAAFSRAFRRLLNMTPSDYRSVQKKTT